MKYEVINSERANSEFNGVFPGYVCGWSFEFRNKDGKIDFNSCSWFEGTAEEYCQTWLRYGEDALFEMERWNGWTPTGRVKFCGYGVERYDPEERDWYIIDANPI